MIGIYLLLFEIIILTLTIRVKNKKIKFLFTFMNLFLAVFLYQNAIKFVPCCGGFDDLIIKVEALIIMLPISIIQLMISIFKK